MPKFSIASEIQLDTCDPRLQKLAREAIKYFDFSVIEGFRNQAQQEADFAKGVTQLHWPNGRHNSQPSRAMDLAPWPVDWSDGEKPHLRFAFMMGVVKVCADQLGIKVRFGMDWNRNLDMRDETFLDYGHVELDQP